MDYWRKKVETDHKRPLYIYLIFGYTIEALNLKLFFWGAWWEIIFMVSEDLEGHLLSDDQLNFLSTTLFFHVGSECCPFASLLPGLAFPDLPDANSDECLGSLLTEGSDDHQSRTNSESRIWEFM